MQFHIQSSYCILTVGTDREAHRRGRDRLLTVPEAHSSQEALRSTQNMRGTM